MLNSESAARTAKTSTGRFRQPLTWLVGCLMLAAVCFGLKGVLPHDAASAAPTAAQSKLAATQRIADIRVGQWVVAQNPQVSDDQRRQEKSLAPVDPAEWHSVSLTMTNPGIIVLASAKKPRLAQKLLLKSPPTMLYMTPGVRRPMPAGYDKG